MSGLLLVSGRIVGVVVLSFSLVIVPVGAKNCSKTLNQVPVQPGFLISKFVGEWFEVSRTKWFFHEDTYDSASVRISQHADGEYYLKETGQKGESCAPIQEFVMKEYNKPGHYILSENNDDAVTMIVAKTDYDSMALVLYCFDHELGSTELCGDNGFHIEILSRNEKPSKRLVRQYKEEARLHLCSERRDLHDTEPGACKIPEYEAEIQDGDDK